MVGRRSRDLITLANQELTREWWETERQKYELFISELVVREAEVGDPSAASSRLTLVASLPLLSIPREAELLAPVLLRAAGLSANAAADSLHMALAAVHGSSTFSLGTASTSRMRLSVELLNVDASRPDMIRL